MNDDELKALFGKRIKTLRESIKLSQEELSVQLEITQRQVSMIERGLSFPKLKTLNKIAQVFNCSVKDLFEYDYLQSEQIIKDVLKKLIDKSDYEKVKTLYLIAKNL